MERRHRAASRARHAVRPGRGARGRCVARKRRRVGASASPQHSTARCELLANPERRAVLQSPHRGRSWTFACERGAARGSGSPRGLGACGRRGACVERRARTRRVCGCALAPRHRRERRSPRALRGHPRGDRRGRGSLFAAEGLKRRITQRNSPSTEQQATTAGGWARPRRLGRPLFIARPGERFQARGDRRSRPAPRSRRARVRRRRLRPRARRQARALAERGRRRAAGPQGARGRLPRPQRRGRAARIRGASHGPVRALEAPAARPRHAASPFAFSPRSASCGSLPSGPAIRAEAVSSVRGDLSSSMSFRLIEKANEECVRYLSQPEKPSSSPLEAAA